MECRCNKNKYRLARARMLSSSVDAGLNRVGQLLVCVTILFSSALAFAAGDEPDQCRAAFANGLQTHGDKGFIDFKQDAQLRNASSNALATFSVRNHNRSTQLSCGDTECSATGQSVQSLHAGDFVRTSSSRTLAIKGTAETLGGDGSRDYHEIIVSSGSSLTFAEQPNGYSIKKLELGDNSTLVLSSGEYWIESFILGANTHIEIVGTDTVRIFLKNPLVVPASSTLNKNLKLPEHLVIFSYSNVHFGENSEAYALIYAEGNVQLLEQVTIIGGITANNILLGSASHVTHKPNAVAIVNFGEICGNPTPLPDYVPPNLTVNQPESQIEAASIIITGTAIDPVQTYSGIASVIAKTSQGLSATAVFEGDAFSINVPLGLGANTITIEARDHSGNLTASEVAVQRISLPRFNNIAPVNGTELRTPSTTISGEVHTDWPVTAIRFSFNQSSITLTEAGPSVYTFSLPNVALQIVENTFSLHVITPDGVDERVLNVRYMPENPESIPAPELTLLSPADGRLLQDATFRLKGHVTSHAGFATVTVNGRAVTAPPAGSQDYYFEDIVSFADGQTALNVVIEATDALHKRTQLSAQYYLDNVPPQIILHGGLQPSPAVNPVVESPFAVKGTVIDAHLTGITANDQPLPLQPGTQPDRYDFSIPLRLKPGEAAPLLFNAYDRSGNQTSIEYLFESTAKASITPLLPGDAAKFVFSGEPVVIQVAARVSELGEGSSVVVMVGGQQATLSVAGTLASGDITLPSQAGEHRLHYQVLDASQTLMASSSITILVHDEKAVAVALTHHKPENAARNVEPNQPVELYFNKAIDASKLTIDVRETLHGETYLNLDASGADFLTAEGYQLQAVHRDNEIVPGVASLLPGNNSLAFYGERHYGFNADVYVDVTYDGEDIGRFVFKVRPLPTFIIGGVADQFGQPLHGVRVTLPELNRTTSTNKDGSFAFGFQEQPGNEIPGGRHTLMINPEFTAPGYGTQVRTINLQAGRKNDISVSRLPELHPDIPFQLITSGQASVSLASDELRLDFSDARLLFSNGRAAGNVQVQFMPFEHVNAAMTPGAWPQWMFAGQPRGVRVEGRVGLNLKMPALNGGYDYIAPGVQYVVLLGYDPQREVIEPIGIGRIENYRVLSVGKVSIKALDYLGYALVDPAQQTLLQDVAEGRTTLQQLLSILQQ